MHGKVQASGEKTDPLKTFPGSPLLPCKYCKVIILQLKIIRNFFLSRFEIKGKKTYLGQLPFQPMDESRGQKGGGEVSAAALNTSDFEVPPGASCSRRTVEKPYFLGGLMTLGRTLTNRPRGRMSKEEMRESLSSANKEYHQQGFVGTQGTRDGLEWRAGVQTQETREEAQ